MNTKLTPEQIAEQEREADLQRSKLQLAKDTLWAHIVQRYPKDPKTKKSTYRVDEYNAPVLRELAHYLVNAPCQWCVNGAGIAIAGGWGTGKTDLMRALSGTISAGGGEGFEIISAVELVNLHDRTARDDRDNGGSKVILRFGNKHADLCIDDLGEEPEGTHFAAKRDVIAEVISLRYNLWKRTGLLTHFTTNIVSDKVLTVKYGERTADRILEMIRVVPLEGPSRRGSSEPVLHKRPSLFDIAEPMPSEEELAERRRRGDDAMAMLKLIAMEAKVEAERSREPKYSTIVVDRSHLNRTQQQDMDEFRAQVERMTDGERSALIDTIKAKYPATTAKPYLDVLELFLPKEAVRIPSEMSH